MLDDLVVYLFSLIKTVGVLLFVVATVLMMFKKNNKQNVLYSLGWILIVVGLGFVGTYWEAGQYIPAALSVIVGFYGLYLIQRDDTL